ncbi:hypothetical protein DFO47_11184 [Arthrobacter sp. AG258]|uniref:hypothetical protein n=1 Tax=Arthrobacter sp. AG258 TaxID=2183899 RepID=UPI00105EE8E9|nr:hypothetical protein [Arthrobacter sp. AG258]TDT75741.1 hypothetical protein DFO47_11184 [Arthrobacter sp. AG258]
MRELLMVTFGLFFVAGGIGTFLWMRTLERRTSHLGWKDPRQAFDKRRLLQFALCMAAATGIYLLAMYVPELFPGTAEINGFGLVLLLVSVIWFMFRGDIAQYQYQTVMTMLNRPRPEQDEAQRQIKAMESLGTGFSILLFSTGMLLLTLSLVFS